MRILLVAKSDSVHTARWISQISDKGWDLHLVPSLDVGATHQGMQSVTVYHSFYGKNNKTAQGTRLKGVAVFSEDIARLGRGALRRYFPKYRSFQLARAISKLRPDVVHSMEIQAAGYLTLEAKRIVGNRFPPWIVTNWGSDIYLFGRLNEHKDKIREVLAACDYYSCECQRDVELARVFGFNGKVLPVFPNSGGFDVQKAQTMRQSGAVSSRRVIMLKGYQDWAGRGLVGLRALERCADLLKGYEIAIYSASPEVRIAAELFEKSTCVPTKIIPECSLHEEILKLHGRSRVSIGLGISDAISTSLLEAMLMGSFPIQSCTSCAEEWIADGETGILVPPEDAEVVEAAIRRALKDDALVDGAAEKNIHLAEEKLDYRKLKAMAVGIYERVAQEARTRQRT